MKKYHFDEIPFGKETLGSSNLPPNEIEKQALKNLDPEKLNDLGESLFMLNNRKYGPIPGTYMVVCIEPNEKWCVGQLNADRAKPFVLFPEHVYNSEKDAMIAAEKLKKEKNEPTPCRNI
jgi:hypothetical protein